MANSNLLKEAIADAKAVRETAIANAKIALEEAFTPRLQSILSQKLTAEMEEEGDEDEVNEEYGVEDTSDADSSKIDGDNKQPQDKVNNSSDVAKTNPDTDVETAEVGLEPDEVEKAKVSEGEESEEAEEVSEGEYNEEGEEEITSESDEMDMDSEEEDEDELDLESIIRELEGELGEELDGEEEGEVEDIASDVVDGHEEEMHEEEDEMEAEPEMGEDDMEDSEEEIDLDEILREMGYGDDEEEVNEEESEEDSSELEEAKAELAEAISTIKSLKGTINEVNLLNAKLLYTNKLFRSYELTNEQKMKVVETLDRTGNVREVKLVFSTLAESFKFTGTTKKTKQTAKLTESFASKPVASTAPSKEVITESTNTMADRFKQLANIK